MSRYWIVIILMTFGCQYRADDSSFFHKNIPVTTQKGLDPEFQGGDAAQFLPVKTLPELFELQQIVPLETRDESIIGVVTDLLFHQNQWFILDQMTCGVYKFDAKGQFLGRFGKRGAGPGEFEHPKRLRLCFDNQLGVADPVQGTIHLFDTEGNFVRATQPHPNGTTVLPRYAFAWNEAQALVIAGFGSANPEAPQHAVVDGRETAYTLRFGFGNRITDIELALRKGSPNRAYTAFEIIDGRYWVGSPFTTHIEIYNQKGEILGRGGNRGTRDPERLIHPDDITGLHKKRNPGKIVRKDLMQKQGNEAIIPIGDWVFVRMGSYYDVYRRNGQRIAMNLRAQNLILNYAFEDYLVMIIPAGVERHLIPEGSLKEALIAAGYDPQDNPHLAIFKMVPHGKLG